MFTSEVWGINVPLNNSGFESSWASPTANPTGWKRSSTSKNFTTSRDVTCKYSGTASVALAKKSSTIYFIYQDIPAAASTTYVLTGKFLDNGYGSIRLQIDFFKGSKPVGTTACSAYSVNSASWQNLDLTFTTPPTANKIRIALKIYDAPAGYRAAIYADNILLDKQVADTIPPSVSITSPLYNTIGYFAPESAYGTPDNLKNLVNEAHKKGIGVIMDVVYNHVGCSDNFMYNYDGDTENNDGGIYFNNVQTPWGLAPDFGRNEVKQYFQDNAMYWLSEFHMDGLRWDATAYIKDKNNGWTFMRDINWNCKQVFPDRILIAENLPYDNALMSGANFHSCWYVDFHHKLQSALESGGYCNLEDVKAAINGGSPDHATWRIIYTISHDETANGSQYNVSQFGGRDKWEARAKCRVFGALLMMSPGIPMLWEGEEFLQDSYFSDNFGEAVNWAYEQDSNGSKMLAMYKAVISTRWLNPALRSATCDYTHEDNNNKVLAFKRYSGNNVILVVANLSNIDFTDHSYGVSTGGQTGQWTQIFCSQDAAYGGWDQAGNAYYEPWTQGDGKIYINLPKYSVIVMKL